MHVLIAPHARYEFLHKREKLVSHEKKFQVLIAKSLLVSHLVLLNSLDILTVTYSTLLKLFTQRSSIPLIYSKLADLFLGPPWKTK